MGSTFSLDSAGKTPVVVLFMNARQEIAPTTDYDTPAERLDEQLVGYGKTIRENFTKHGIMDVLQIRPYLSSSKVQGVFPDDLFDRKPTQPKRKNNIKNIFKMELELFSTELCKRRCLENAPNQDDMEITPITPRDPELSRLRRTSSSIYCVSPTSSTDLEALVGHMESSFENKDNINNVVNDECRDIMEANGLVAIDVRHSTPMADLIYAIRKTSVEDLDVVSCTSPETLYREEQTHIDILTTENSREPETVMHPFVHFTMADWKKKHKKNPNHYWHIQKREKMRSDPIHIKTLKQLREEDRRHVERLKCKHAWDKKLEALGLGGE